MTTSQTPPFEWTKENALEFGRYLSEADPDRHFTADQENKAMQEFINLKTYGWKVLALRGEVSGRLYVNMKGKWVDKNSMNDRGFEHDFYTDYTYSGYTIESVLRVSDNEIFTAGQEVMQGKLEGFAIRDKIMFAFCGMPVAIDNLVRQPTKEQLITTQHDAIVKYNEIIEFAKKVQTHSAVPSSMEYNALALTGEAGEIANVIKKLALIRMHPDWVTDQDGLSPEELCHDLTEEMGDVLFYLFRLMLDHGTTLWEVIDCQARKLNYNSEKYGRTFLK